MLTVKDAAVVLIPRLPYHVMLFDFKNILFSFVLILNLFIFAKKMGVIYWNICKHKWKYNI